MTHYESLLPEDLATPDWQADADHEAAESDAQGDVEWCERFECNKGERT